MHHPKSLIEPKQIQDNAFVAYVDFIGTSVRRIKPRPEYLRIALKLSKPNFFCGVFRGSNTSSTFALISFYSLMERGFLKAHTSCDCILLNASRCENNPHLAGRFDFVSIPLSFPYNDTSRFPRHRRSLRAFSPNS